MFRHPHTLVFGIQLPDHHTKKASEIHENMGGCAHICWAGVWPCCILGYLGVVTNLPVLSENYAAAFGKQWKRYSLTQLDSYTGLPITRTRALRCIGEANLSWIRGMRTLEAGCGSGRFTEILLSLG